MLYELLLHSDVALTDFQVKLTLPELDSDFATDLSNLRFWQGSQALAHWVEDIDNRIVWVKVPTINEGYTKIYLENGSNVGRGDANAVFLFFDDFEGTELDTSRWYIENTNYTVENSYIKMWGDWNTAGIFSQNTFDLTQGIIIEWKGRLGVTGADVDLFVHLTPDRSGFAEGNSVATLYDSYGTTNIYDQKCIRYIDNGTWDDSPGAGLPNTTNWVRMRSTFLSDKTVYWDEVLGILEHAHTVSWTDVYIGIAGDTDASTRYGYIDWLAVRKYADPEPTLVSTHKKPKVFLMSTSTIYSSVAKEIVHRSADQITCPIAEASLYEIRLSSQTTLVDYQVKLTLSELDYPFEYDLSNLRFWWEGQVIPHWVEDADNRIVWVKVPVIDSDTKIYLDVGPNVGRGDGESTFEFFDDFEGTELDTSRWYIENTNYTVENSYIKMWETWDTTGIFSQNTFDLTQGIIIEWKGRLGVTGADVDLGVYITPDKSGLSEGNNMCTIYDSYGTDNAYDQKFIRYRIEDVNYDSGAGLPNTTNWVRMRSTFLSDKIIFWDEVLDTHEYAKSVTWTDVYIGITADTDASTRYGYIDWLAVRKYADPEPTVEYITPIKVPLLWFNRWISLLSPYAVYRLYASLYHDTHRLTDVLHNDIIASSTTSHDRAMETVQITSDKHESISLTSSTNAVFGPNYTPQELTIARFIASTTNTDYIQQRPSQTLTSFIVDNIISQTIIDAQYRKYEMILKHVINKDQILKYISDNIVIKQIQSMFESEHSILYADTAIEGAQLVKPNISS